MNKYLIWLLIILALTSCNASESANEWINRKFKINLPFQVEQKSVIVEDRDWFIAIQLQPSQTKQIRECNFKSAGYSGWQKNDQNIHFGVTKSYDIRRNDSVMVNYKNGGVIPYNYIAMYLNVKSNILVFYWGITYGR